MDSNAVMVILVIVVALVGVSIFASNSKKKEIPRYTSALDSPTYRWKGERGSSGEPGFKHSSNCEWNMCSYHHDPNKGSGCKCKACTDPESVYGR